MKPTNITRRTGLKAIAGAAGLAGLGGLGLYASGQGAATHTTIDISDTSVGLDDGDVHFVDLVIDDYYAIWDGFDLPVAAVAFRDRIRRPSAGVSHELFDQRGDDADPVMLDNISLQDGSAGAGGGSWGGPDEYASTFDELTAPDTTVIQPPGDTGPEEATAGWVHAGVDWRVLSDDPANEAKSIETPGDIDEFGLNVGADGNTVTFTLEMIKEVYLYRTLLDTEAATDRDAVSQDGTDLVLLGSDEGTLARVQADPTFDVTVTNQENTEDADGTGSSNSG